MKTECGPGACRIGAGVHRSAVRPDMVRLYCIDRQL